MMLLKPVCEYKCVCIFTEAANEELCFHAMLGLTKASGQPYACVCGGEAVGT